MKVRKDFIDNRISGAVKSRDRFMEGAQFIAVVR